MSAFALFCLFLLSLGRGKFDKSIRTLANCLGNLDGCSGQCSKVNSAFHASEVYQMSTMNSWGLSDKKNVQALALSGEGRELWWGNHCSTSKIGLSSPVPLIVFPKNAEFVVFTQFLVIFPKISTLPPQSIPNGKSWSWNSSWHHGFITQIFGATNKGGHHLVFMRK